jgi:hypothetical protein
MRFHGDLQKRQTDKTEASFHGDVVQGGIVAALQCAWQGEVRMKPLSGAYTVAMPWYEEEDFARLWSLAHDRDEISPDYAEWHRNARRVLAEALAAGKAIQIVTIKPDAYLAWLGSAPNTAAARLRYVEQIAAGMVSPAGLVS